MLCFSLLGRLRVVRDGEVIAVRPPKQRTILACMLVRANDRLDLSELAEEVWGGDPPPSARANIRTYVNAIRRSLGVPGDAVLSTVEGGYVIRAEPDQLDMQQFRQLVASGRAAQAAGQLDRALSCLDQALALSSGPALADVPTGPLLGWHAATLDAELIEATEDRASALLQLDRPADALTLLRRHVAHHPLRERAHALLMAALYRTGDSAAALEAYQRARAVLREQLGIEPGPDLRQAQQAVLMRDTAAALGFRERVVGGGRAADGAAHLPPRQLPPATAIFVGRAHEHAYLHRAACAPHPRARPTVLAIHGPGGVGKSTLAVRVAHDLLDRFPDGQLYLDLQGATPALPALPPRAALARLLAALGLPPSQISGDLAEAVGQFRSLLAGRRVLILLDNVADTAQVAPLVPAADGCLVLVTSRALLATLDGAVHVPLGPLSAEDSVGMLMKLLGPGRVAAEPAAAQTIGRLCENLPLSLRVAGARLVAQPNLALGRLADRLADERQRLDLLELPELSVRASLRTSYLQLRQSPSDVDIHAARAFRLLASLSLPSFEVGVVSALLDQPAARAEAVVERLVELRLVDSPFAERFRVHDLLRLVGGELAVSDESTSELAGATGRAIDYYVASAWRAASVFRPGILPSVDDPRIVAPPYSGTFADAAAAAAWLEQELPTLLAVAQHYPTEAARYLLRALCLYLAPRAHWAMLGELASLARQAAFATDDRAGEAVALDLLGLASHRLGDNDAALAHLGASLELRQQLQDPREAVTLQYLGLILYEMNHYGAAVACYARAVRQHRVSGAVLHEAVGLHNLGEVYAALDRPHAAERFLRRSLKIRTAAEERFGLARGYVSLGRMVASRGDLDAAHRWLDLGTAQAREIGYGEAEWEGHLIRAEIALRQDDPSTAVEELHRAGQLTDGLGRPYLRGVVLHQLARVYRLLGEVALADSSDAAAAEILAACASGRDPALEAFLAQHGPVVRRRAGPAHGAA